MLFPIFHHCWCCLNAFLFLTKLRSCPHKPIMTILVTRIWIQCNWVLIQLLNWIKLNWNSIQFNSNSNQCIWFNYKFEFTSIKYESNYIKYEFNLRWIQCHSIFSLKWNLNFHKINSFFSQLISWSSLVVCSSANPKFLLYNAFQKWQ